MRKVKATMKGDGAYAVRAEEDNVTTNHHQDSGDSEIVRGITKF